jgi:hypothetical protein
VEEEPSAFGEVEVNRIPRSHFQPGARN